MTLDDVQDAIVDWAQTAAAKVNPAVTTAQVIWEGQQASSPEAMFIKLRWGDMPKLGATDEEQQTTVQPWATGTVYEFGAQSSYGGNLWQVSVIGPGTSTDAPAGIPTADGYTWTSQGAIAGQEITITEFGRRSVSVSVQCFGTIGQEAGSMSPSAVLEAVQQALELPTPRGKLNAVGISPFDSSAVRNVAALAGTIYEPRAIFEVQFYINTIAQEQTGYIETVNVQGELVSPGDPLSPLEVDFTATSS